MSNLTIAAVAVRQDAAGRYCIFAKLDKIIGDQIENGLAIAGALSPFALLAAALVAGGAP